MCDCALRRIAAKEVGPLHAKAELTAFAPEMQKEILAWCDHPGHGLLLTGETGVGKTYLAAALARSFIMARQVVKFFSCAEFYLDLRTAMGSGQEATQLEYYSVPNFAVFDDVGAGGLSDFERRSLLLILDRRLRSKKPTIVTTNWSLAKIAEMMDDRIADRLSLFHQIEMHGKSRRVRL